MTSQESKPRRVASGGRSITQIVEDQQLSGLSVAAYSKKHGVSAWRIYQALRSAAEQAPDFVEVAKRSDTKAGALPEIVLPGGFRIAVPRDFDAPTLLRLLEVMRPC